MKKLLVILAILLVPVSASGGNIFSHIFKGKNYAPLCSTSPASSPVAITLREIRYESDSTYIEKRSDTRSEVTSKPAKVYIEYAVRNKSKKTVTACYFHIKVYYNSMGTLGGTLYEGNVTRMGCNIRPGKKLVDTIHERYTSSNNSHELIKSGFANDVSKIIAKVYFVKYSDGKSESFNPDL